MTKTKGNKQNEHERTDDIIMNIKHKKYQKRYSAYKK